MTDFMRNTRQFKFREYFHFMRNIFKFSDIPEKFLNLNSGTLFFEFCYNDEKKSFSEVLIQDFSPKNLRIEYIEFWNFVGIAKLKIRKSENVEHKSDTKFVLQI
jgi:hypothetical protein